MKLKLTIIFMTLFFVGVAIATPTKIDDRTEYSTTLNTIAAVVMNWYGSLITEDQKMNSKYLFDASLIEDQWGEYRSRYPKNISQIIITNTDLLKLAQGNGYQFKVESKITHKVNNKNQTRSLNETFVFKDTLLLNKNTFLVKSVTKDKSKIIQNINNDQYNRGHYKVREFTYAWLAYIDGVKKLSAIMNATAWLDHAPYSLNMGGKKSKDSIKNTLEKRSQLLAKGGHLLHLLEIKQHNNDSNTFVIDLILEWKGSNPKGKPVIARIHQEIEVKVNADQSWEVISISEEHLLPIITPWMGLVC